VINGLRLAFFLSADRDAFDVSDVASAVILALIGCALGGLHFSIIGANEAGDRLDTLLELVAHSLSAVALPLCRSELPGAVHISMGRGHASVGTPAGRRSSNFQGGPAGSGLGTRAATD